MALAKILGWGLGLVGLFGVTFAGTVAYTDHIIEEQEERQWKADLEEFINYNPSRVNVRSVDTEGDIDIEKLESEGKVVIEYQGRFLGKDKFGNAKYTLPKPHYLVFDKNDLTGEKLDAIEKLKKQQQITE